MPREGGSENTPPVELGLRDLLRKLDEQFDFLVKNIQQFDIGSPLFAYQAASNIRNLVSPNQKLRLLIHLASRLKVNLEFRSKPGGRIDPQHPDAPLVYMSNPISPGHVAPDDPFARVVPFDEWWGELIESEQVGDRMLQLTRGEAISHAVQREGGAHVEPKIPEKFARLTANKKGSRIVSADPTMPPRNIVQSIVINSGRELVRVYRNIRNRLEDGILLEEINSKKAPKLRRNRLCPCGSGSRFKSCHGKLS